MVLRGGFIILPHYMEVGVILPWDLKLLICLSMINVIIAF